MLFLCKLINGHVVEECFYRYGYSAEAVKEGLSVFQWADGEWVIEEM